MTWQWLLTRKVAVGECISFTDWMLWHYGVLLAPGALLS